MVEWWENGQISQWSFNECPAIVKTSQWSVNDRPVISTVTTVSAKFWLSPKQSLNDHQRNRSLNEGSTNPQWTLNECSMNTQGVLNDLIDFPTISMIFQWILIFFLPQRRDGWEINKRTRISHRNGFFIAVERSLRDRDNFWSPNDLCPV